MSSEDPASGSDNETPEILIRDVADADIPAIREIYAHHCLDTTLPYPGVVSTLERLRGKTMGVVTNKPVRFAELLLKELDLRRFFRTVLGGDSLKEKKPHPLPIIHFLEQFGIEAGQAAMIGDGGADIQAGKAAGVTTFGIAYGVLSPKKLADEKPDFLLERFEELLNIIS